MKIDATEIIRFFTFVLLCVFLWLGLQAYNYMENYNNAVVYVGKQYEAAYSNLSCCVCRHTYEDLDLFNFTKRPNVSVDG